MLRRTLARIDVSSRTLFALIEPGSCFAGTFAEFAFACDRSYNRRVAGQRERRTGADIVGSQLRPLSDDHPASRASPAASTTKQSR